MGNVYFNDIEGKVWPDLTPSHIQYASLIQMVMISASFFLNSILMNCHKLSNACDVL